MTIAEITINNFESFPKIDVFITPIQKELINTLEYFNAMTRRDLVSLLSIPRTTIYDNLLKLKKKRIVERFSENNGKVGRPLILWKLV